jgi:hypothetical protein
MAVLICLYNCKKKYLFCVPIIAGLSTGGTSTAAVVRPSPAVIPYERTTRVLRLLHAASVISPENQNCDYHALKPEKEMEKRHLSFPSFVLKGQCRSYYLCKLAFQI